MNSLLHLYDQYLMLKGADGLLEHIAIFNPGYEVPQHLKPLAEAFNDIIDGKEIFLLSSVPPAHGKSFSLSNWCALYLRRHPTHSIAYITYSQTLALKQSRICQETATKLGMKLKDDATSLKGWQLEQGGGFYCAGRGGTITGFHFNVIIIDDSLANREEAESQIIKDGLEAWFGSTVYSRLKKGGSIIVNGTRWAPDDLIGRLQDNNDDNKWAILNIPAIDATGSALWPSQFPIDALEDRRRRLGDYDFSALYMGSPVPKGSVAFKSATFYDYPHLHDARVVIGVDPAASSKNHADFSVICVASSYGVGLEQNVEVLDMWYGQVEIPDLVDKIEQYANDWGAAVYVESVGGFKGIGQMLRRINPKLKVYENHPTTDKFTRALPLIAAWNDGRVQLPKEGADDKNHWVQRLLKETRAFTAAGSATHDDTVDALNICWLALQKPINKVSTRHKLNGTHLFQTY